MDEQRRGYYLCTERQQLCAPHGESISGGIQGKITALMYKIKDRESERTRNVHKLIALSCVCILTGTEQADGQYLAQRLPSHSMYCSSTKPILLNVSK